MEKIFVDRPRDRATLAESTERVVSILQAEIATIGADKACLLRPFNKDSDILHESISSNLWDERK